MAPQNTHSARADMFVLTANRFSDGRVVWLTPQGYWSIMLEEAHIFSRKEEVEQMLENVSQTLSARSLVDLHYTELETRTTPNTAREKIRAFGPSTHPEFNPRLIQDQQS